MVVEEVASLQPFSLGFTTGRRGGTLPGLRYHHGAVCQANSMQLLQRMSKIACLADFVVGFCSTKRFPDIWLANAVFLRIQPSC